MADDHKLNVNGIVTGPNMLMDLLKDIDHISDGDLYLIMKHHYSVFLSNAIDAEIFSSLRRNPRFITILSQVIIEVDLTLEQRIYCNSMIYKELSNVDPENLYLQRVYYILGMHANQNMMNKILQAGPKMNKGLATYLAIVRKSSFKQKDNISRLNFTIMCDTPENMTVQTIANIYCAIFNTVDEVKSLFFLTVRDTYVFTSNEPWITDDILKIAGNMNFAVLSVLEALNIEQIKKILLEYSNMSIIEDLEVSDVRFSFNRLDLSKFPKIQTVVNFLKSEHDVDLL